MTPAVTINRRRSKFYVELGPFESDAAANRAAAAVIAAVDFPDQVSLGRRKLRFEDGSLTRMGACLIWVEDAGADGVTTDIIGRSMGLSRKAANAILTRLADAGYVKRRRIGDRKINYYVERVK